MVCVLVSFFELGECQPWQPKTRIFPPKYHPNPLSIPFSFSSFTKNLQKHLASPMFFTLNCKKSIVFSCELEYPYREYFAHYLLYLCPQFSHFYGRFPFAVFFVNRDRCVRSVSSSEPLGTLSMIYQHDCVV